MKPLLLLLALFPILNGNTAVSDVKIKKALQEFKKDHNAFYFNYNKRDQRIQSLRDLSRNFVIDRVKSLASSKSAPLYNDKVEDLLRHQKLERNLVQIDSEKLTSGRVSEHPWSDDYWPIYKGILGNRYADPEFRETYDWDESHNYVLANPVANYSQEMINLLSPSEKFDLLFSGSQFSLTKRMWAQGKSYFDNFGSVERWMGICHGWAPASFMAMRPTKPIEVSSYNGDFKIKFYPADIKALTSLLWASAKFETNFVGGRCRSKDPELSDNDRPIAKDCLDSNPATFHLALVNRIGISKKSFVMDATYDYEVWNQPVISYDYKYFNPQSKEPKANIQEAIIPIADYVDDPYKDTRGSKSKKVVGITLEVFYGVETNPEQREFDNEELDASNSASYYYDLELDDKNNIIGGEWYNLQHPDFLWMPADGERALTGFDYYLLSQAPWDGKEALPANVADLANRAASQGMPLAYLVNSLIKLAQ
jgi:hypothetical protein